MCDHPTYPGMSHMISMKVVKRDGSLEDVSFDKVLQRIQICAGIKTGSASSPDQIQFTPIDVNPTLIAQRTLLRIYDGVKTSELDELAAQLSMSLVTTHPDYGILAGRIIVSNHQRSTSPSFVETMRLLKSQVNPKTGMTMAYLSDEFIATVEAHATALDAAVIANQKRDYLLDYFGFKTVERQKYLLRGIDGKVLERPQHMWMRVAVGIWSGVEYLERILETYELLSTKQFIHATPTMFNAGSPRAQMSSCYLLSMSEDSIAGIYKTLADCAQISKYAGGIGLHIHNIRAKGSYIAGNGGTSTGIVPMLRNFNATARYVDQGSKRNGSFAIYLEPWHADVEDFLKLKMPTGSEEERARDLFYALWIPDLFMERVRDDKLWTLFCPSEAPGLADVWGDSFKSLYEGYEAEGKGRKQIEARVLWNRILDSQIETGTPYLLYKDAANSKSNQQNLGTIKSSNLCTEIIEYSSPEETAVCNLASLALPAFVKGRVFDFAALRRTVKVAVRNLNRVIDINFYPTPETRTSNLRHRPIGIGVQGLADVFAMLRLPWEREETHLLHKRIFEHIYYAALEASAELASVDGPYSSFSGSPVSKGILQYDMWSTESGDSVVPVTAVDGTLDWEGLKERVKAGIRNSLLVAPMPTASTSQILGYNECFEPVTSNIYTRRTLSGEFIVLNRYLVRDLLKLGMWTEDMKNQIIIRNGSIQTIEGMPEAIKNLYKTAWEIKQKTLINMAADRGAFICQSQSLNLFMDSPNYAKLSSMHIYGWSRGLKTGIYYLRTKAPVMAQKFTIDPDLQRDAEKSEQQRQQLEGAVEDGCTTCSA